MKGCVAAIPMRPDIDPEQRTKDLVAAWTASASARLEKLKKQEPDKTQYALPLPWYAHEDSRELELIVEHFKPAWSGFKVCLGTGCLLLVFVK